MSKTIDINGVRFESSAIVAQRFGYTSDYVARLAREGKFKTTRVGRLWFIDPDSFSQYQTQVERMKVERSNKLKEERKMERDVQAVISIEATPVNSEKRFTVYSDAHVAFAQAIAVVMCGFFVGSLGWVVSEENLQVAQLHAGSTRMFEQIHSSVSPNLQSLPIIPGVKKVMEAQKLELYAVFPVVQFIEKVDPSESISRETDPLHFSDEVNISYTGTDDGVQLIQPIFKDGTTGKEYVVSVDERNQGTQ